ncbi:MAG: hypothetical protein EOM64_01285 [Erysipelotrichia bacterium]|nr:hypothetical protein [Erysipelotrichia bacterium]
MNRIVILHSHVTGPIVTQQEKMLAKWNCGQIKKIEGLLFMEDLLVRYEAAPIQYAENENDPLAFILHTSGTTKGIMKPVPLHIL